MVESPRQGGSPQAKAGRKYGGQPQVDERSCGADKIRAKPIPRPTLYFGFLLDFRYPQKVRKLDF